VTDSQVLVVLDVGVRGGPHPRWAPLGPSVQVIGVDADASECKRLGDQPSPVPVRYVACALGGHDGEERTLHITRRPGCSSLLEPDPQFLRQFPVALQFDVVDTMSVTTTTLDTMCQRERISPHVLKLDTQGTELEILRGGETALANAFLVEVEVEFNPIYKNQGLFADMDAFLRSRGFGLLGLRRDYWRRTAAAPSSAGGTLAHGDALFYRVDVPEQQKPLFARALGAYGQHDFAYSLGYPVAANGRSGSLLERILGKVLRGWMPHRRLREFVDRSRPAGAIDWHDADYFVLPWLVLALL
jgi:FkbM family methyltransferase